jgi:hypothetical protein
MTTGWIFEGIEYAGAAFNSEKNLTDVFIWVGSGTTFLSMLRLTRDCR